MSNRLKNLSTERRIENRKSRPEKDFFLFRRREKFEKGFSFVLVEEKRRRTKSFLFNRNATLFKVKFERKIFFLRPRETKFKQSFGSSTDFDEKKFDRRKVFLQTESPESIFVFRLATLFFLLIVLIKRREDKLKSRKHFQTEKFRVDLEFCLVPYRKSLLRVVARVFNRFGEKLKSELPFSDIFRRKDLRQNKQQG